MVEMAVFMLLIVPMPFKLKRKIFTYVPAAFFFPRLFSCRLPNPSAEQRAASSRRTPSSPR